MKIRVIATVLIALMASAGCHADAAPPSRTTAVPTYRPDMPRVDPDTWALRGTVVSTPNLNDIDGKQLPAGSTILGMIYRSVSGVDGSIVTVSGAVFVPPGHPPAGGWPVIGYAHGTVGVTPNCSPTGDRRLYGDIDAVAVQLRLGYAVVFTDYAGLGDSKGPDGAQVRHPYLEPRSAAFNLIDAVRAARSVVPELSSRWVALGASQGGGTAWAAAEYFADYGRGTDLLGAAVLVPVLDLRGLADRARAGTLTVDQTYLYPYVISGLGNADPTISTGDYLHGAMLENESVLTACAATQLELKASLRDALTPSTTRPTSVEAADRLAARLASFSLPQRRSEVPLLSIYGGDDLTVPPEWTEVAMGRACALGDVLDRVRVDGQGHSLDPGAMLGQWIAARFADAPASGNC